MVKRIISLSCEVSASDSNEIHGMDLRSVTYWDPISIFLTDSLGLGLALLEGVLVLELRSHG